MENLKQIIHLISRGDTSSAELLFNKPGGRKYLESMVLVVVTGLPYEEEEKVDLFGAFIKGLDKIERRINRQKEGQKILNQVCY
ncbi:MAG TPA: hypothetical protein VLI68_13985 [Hanamia sp.]|nr:hypothetical protein [Hanamia sp.]